MADTAEQRLSTPGNTWERELMLESLESYRRGLCEPPIIRKWSASTGGGDRAETWAEGEKGAEVNPEESSMTFVISTDEIDRHGDVIAASGWQIDSYSRNPVFLWAHDYARPVIGKAEGVWKEPHSLMARVQFAPTAFAQEVAALYRTGFQRGVSVGFKPLRYEERRHEKTGALLGLRFLEQELLETSAVPVPSNRSALSRTTAQAPLTKGFLERATQSRDGPAPAGCGEACWTALQLLWPELSSRLDGLEKLAGELAHMTGQVSPATGSGPPDNDLERVLAALRASPG